MGLVITPWRSGQRALALEREQALGGEALLQCLEAEVCVARAGGAQIVHPQLHAALAVVVLDVPMCDELRPVARRERDLRRLGLEEDARELTDLVAEREVHVAGRRHL
jgi:hypothetical protein